MPNQTHRLTALQPSQRSALAPTYAVVARVKPARRPLNWPLIWGWTIALVLSLAAWAGIVIAIAALIAWL
jgi:hypothetical protein